LFDKALHYLRCAGKASADAYQNSQAVDYFTRALVFTLPDDLITQYDLLVERVELYSRMGKRDLQWKDLTALERWADELGEIDRIAIALMLRAAYYFVIGNYLDAIDCAKRAQTHSTAMINSELTLYTEIVWFLALLRLGRLDEAMQRAQETLKRDRAAGNRKEECRTLTAMGLIAHEQREPAAAQQYLLEALVIAREIKDPSLEARALNNLARSEEAVNRNYALAMQYYEQSYKIAREIGDRNAESFTLSNLGFAAGLQGDFVNARLFHEQALVAAREIGNPYNETYTLINLSSIVALQSDAVSALHFAQMAAELAKKISEPAGEAWALHYMGHAHLLQNQIELAHIAFRRSIAIRRKLDQPSLAMEPIAGLVEAYMQLNDLESASHEAEKILQFLDSGSTLAGTDEPLRVYYACYQLLEEKRDPRAKHILQTANALLEAQVSKFTDEAVRKRYIENIPWRRAIQAAARSSQG
jgi:tetratricopeptide (TPR) repeat protein